MKISLLVIFIFSYFYLVIRDSQPVLEPEIYRFAENGKYREAISLYDSFSNEEKKKFIGSVLDAIFWAQDNNETYKACELIFLVKAIKKYTPLKPSELARMNKVKNEYLSRLFALKNDQHIASEDLMLIEQEKFDFTCFEASASEQLVNDH